MGSIQYLLEDISIARDDLEKIEDKISKCYFDSKYIFRRFILELYEHYRDGECYVPRIEDIDPKLKLKCSRKDVGAILNWIRELLPILETCDDEYEYVIEYINNDEVGIDMRNSLSAVHEAMLCIEHELKRKCSQD